MSKIIYSVCFPNQTLYEQNAQLKTTPRLSPKSKDSSSTFKLKKA